MTPISIYDILSLMEKGNSYEIAPTPKYNGVLENANATSATLLHFAAHCGNATIAKYYIDSGKYINVLDKFGKSPLARAVDSNNDEIVKLLLEANADIYGLNDRGASILESVVGSHVTWSNADTKRRSIVKMFLEKIKTDHSNDLETMAQTLLKAYCPLHLVIKYVKIIEVTRKMLNAGRSANELELVTDISALHVAVELADVDHVKLLIERGADVNAKDHQERTPLQLRDPASDDTDDKLGVLKILVKRGAALAVPGAKWPIARQLLLFGKKQTVDVVLQRVSLFSRDDRGDTPLHFLVCNRNPGVLHALRDKRFDANACNQRGYTILMSAAMRGSFSSVDFLLSNGADVNFVNPSGFTALFYAYFNSSLEKEEMTKMAKLMLRYGADLQHELPNDRMTIFDFAKSYVSLQPVLDHLAMIDTAGHRISETIRRRIDGDEILKTYYYCFARKQYERTSWTTRG